jgi:hypothetical protein
VTVLNSQRELMAAAMKYLGYSVQETDPTRWAEAKRLILRAKPYWAAFSNSTYIKDLAIGNIWVAHGYSSDMYRAQQDALEAKRPFAIDFRTPKEGAVLAVDSFVLHKSGQRADLAHQFINFMLDGANAADVSNLIGAGNPNAAATPYISPRSPAIQASSHRLTICGGSKCCATSTRKRAASCRACGPRSRSAELFGAGTQPARNVRTPRITPPIGSAMVGGLALAENPVMEGTDMHAVELAHQTHPVHHRGQRVPCDLKAP